MYSNPSNLNDTVLMERDWEKEEKMTIIVTGGVRFIGSNFIFYMMEKYPEDRIVCVDKLTYAGNLSTLASVMEKTNFRFCKK